MADTTKKSGLKPKLQKAKAKFFTTYYSNPAKDLKIIVVTGNNGRDVTAHFIQNMLKNRDENAGIIIDPTTTSSLYKQMFNVWKSGADHVVVAVNASDLANHLFYGLPIHMAVLTDNSEDTNSAITGITGDEEEGKAILFNTKPDFSIINRDNVNYELFAQYPTTTATFSYGRERSSDMRINRSKLYKVGSEANLTYGSESFDVATYVTSEAAIYYMAAAALAGFALGFNADQIVDAIADYEPENTKL